MKTMALYGVGLDSIYWVRVNVSGDLEKLTLTSSKPLHTLMRFCITRPTRSKCPVYVINPSVMRDLNLKATTGSDPGIPYTAMSLCATAKVFASPRTVFTQMDAAATIMFGSGKIRCLFKGCVY